jgi:hypothetical protein
MFLSDEGLNLSTTISNNFREGVKWTEWQMKWQMKKKSCFWNFFSLKNVMGWCHITKPGSLDCRDLGFETGFWNCQDLDWENVKNWDFRVSRLFGLGFWNCPEILNCWDLVLKLSKISWLPRATFWNSQEFIKNLSTVETQFQMLLIKDFWGWLSLTRQKLTCNCQKLEFF